MYTHIDTKFLKIYIHIYTKSLKICNQMHSKNLKMDKPTLNFKQFFKINTL